MRAVARWVSILGHPFVLVPAALFLATSEGAVRSSRGPVLALVAASIVVLSVFVVRRLRRGEIADVDVSTREHRPAMYGVAIASAVGSVVALQLTHQAPPTVRGAAVSAVLLVASAVVNLRLKASLHTSFALMAAGIAYRASHVAALVFAVLALAVAWSRVAYGRHTRREVVAGAVLGAIAATAQAFV